MNKRCTVVLVAFLLGFGGASTRGGEPDAKSKAVVGRVALLNLGAILRQEGGGWKLLKPGADVVADDLLVGVPSGQILSKNGAVRLSLLSDLARISPYPVLESAVRLHENSDVDLDFTIDRGRVDVTNNKKGSGSAKVKVRVLNESAEIVLLEPKTRVAFELYGRWPAGSPFRKNPKPDEVPTLDLIVLVVEGEIEVKAGGRQFPMKMPPGNAIFHWDNVHGAEEHPRRLEALPGWAKPGLSMVPTGATAKDFLSIIASLQKRFKEQTPGSIEEVFTTNLADESPRLRNISIYALGALDYLSPIIDAIAESKFPNARETAIIALRHWIGRAPGQDLKLHDFLVSQKKYSDKHAEIFVQLLHTPGDVQKSQPATYETLIDLLLHEKPAIRELAAWHLYRLAPAGKDIRYDAIASKEEREKARAEWKKLVPDGQLPPKG